MHTNMLYVSMCINMYVYRILSNKLGFSNKDPKDHGTEFQKSFLQHLNEKNPRF